MNFFKIRKTDDLKNFAKHGINCEDPKFREELEKWLSIQELNLADFVTALKAKFNLEFPVEITDFDSINRTFLCVSKDGMSIVIQLKGRINAEDAYMNVTTTLSSEVSITSSYKIRTLKETALSVILIKEIINTKRLEGNNKLKGEYESDKISLSVSLDNDYKVSIYAKTFNNQELFLQGNKSECVKIEEYLMNTLNSFKNDMSTFDSFSIYENFKEIFNLSEETISKLERLEIDVRKKDESPYFMQYMTLSGFCLCKGKINRLNVCENGLRIQVQEHYWKCNDLSNEVIISGKKGMFADNDEEKIEFNVALKDLEKVVNEIMPFIKVKVPELKAVKTLEDFINYKKILKKCVD